MILLKKDQLILGGIDGGGTTTRCVLLNGWGEVIAKSCTGPANYQVVGLREGVRQVKRALRLACKRGGVEEIHVLGLGLAGAGREEDQERWQKALALPQVQKLYYTDDGTIAVYGAYGGKPGLVLISGTGSIAYALTKEGDLKRRGGFGPLLGDEGSGYWIGLKALQAFLKGKEGRGKETLLSYLIGEELDVDDPRELLSQRYQKELSHTRIASLTRLVIFAMEAKDPVAISIIHEAVKELSSLVKALNTQERELVLMGGVLSHPIPSLLLSESLKEYQVKKPLYPAVLGAVLYGALKAGIEVTLKDDPLGGLPKDK